MYTQLLILIIPLVGAPDIVEYLHNFGYIDDISLTLDVGPALKSFQEAFHLEPTGVVDNATLDFIEQPRCGNTDTPQAFTVLPSRKWQKTVITWYLYGYSQHNQLVQRAFDVWGKHTNIIFKRTIVNPTIIISFGDKKHYYFAIRDDCQMNFDGQGLILAHAYPPSSSMNQTDIHLDNEELWDFSMDIPTGKNRSVFFILVHEIGHALGIGHSYSNNSVMFPYHRMPEGIKNMYELELQKDDIYAIQFLYGRPSEKTISATVPTTTSTITLQTTTTTETSTREPEPLADYNICSFRKEISKLVIVNEKIYAFYRELVWVLDLDPATRKKYQYIKPKRVTDWLSFLPKNSSTITAVYQGPDDTVHLFYDNYVYVIRYPSMSLTARYTLGRYIGQGMNFVNAAISTNRGKTFIITDSEYLIEFNESNLKPTLLGTVSKHLHGIPGDIKGAFRYINGRLYFITDSRVLEYNEFTNSVTGSFSDALEVLQLACMGDTLMRSLYEVLRYLQ